MILMDDSQGLSGSGLAEWRYGGGATETVLHPLVLAAMLVTIVIMLGLPRKFRLPAFLFSTFLIPAGQEILLGGVHIFVYRIIVLAGLFGSARSRQRQQKFLSGGWNSLDTAFLFCVVCHIVAFSLLNLSAGVLANQVGYAWDYLGGYFLLRHLIRSQDDINITIKYFCYLVMIFAVCMVREQMTGRNVFGFLGGVRAVSEVREGRIRSQAVFQHAILAGTFAGVMVPLFIWLWKSGKARVLSIGGIIGSAVMALTTACSTPLLTYGAGIAAVCLWPFRRRIRYLGWAVLIILVGLQLVMKAPVWALIQRVDVVQGSSSHHRYELVDQFIAHVGDWWLLGTNSNGAWGNEMIDTSNAYVQEGITGGIFALAFFILLISRAFRKLSEARRSFERENRQKAWLVWLLRAALFANVVAFFGIYYFDQTRVAWFALLCMISAVTVTEASQVNRQVAGASSNRRPVQLAAWRELDESKVSL
jgi:hypothetical protein